MIDFDAEPMMGNEFFFSAHFVRPDMPPNNAICVRPAVAAKIVIPRADGKTAWIFPSKAYRPTDLHDLETTTLKIPEPCPCTISIAVEKRRGYTYAYGVVEMEFYYEAYSGAYGTSIGAKYNTGWMGRAEARLEHFRVLPNVEGGPVLAVRATIFRVPKERLRDLLDDAVNGDKEKLQILARRMKKWADTAGQKKTVVAQKATQPSGHHII